MTVWCEDCEFMTLPYKDAPARQALCMRHKNVGGHGFVSREAWASETPYLTCDRMNPRGTCPLFERKRDGQIEMET